MSEQMAAGGRAGEGPAPPELAGLVGGLARLLETEAVRSWWGPAEPAALAELRKGLSPADVAVVCLTAGAAQGAQLSLRGALDAASDAGLEVAWTGLTRNSVEDIRRETPLLIVARERAQEVREALAAGTASLLFDREAPAGTPLQRPVRVCVASYEVVGPTKNGGIGTANTSLAELLATAGHEVTLLYTGWQALDDSTRAHWARHYARRGVEFMELRCEPPVEVDTPHFNSARAFQLYRWLAERDAERSWDVIHFPECQGHAYYTLLARRLGLAFAGTTIVVGVHSPTRWVFDANRWTIDNAHRLADDFLERRSVAMADVVVSPSAYLLAWMERNGWELPERRFVEQYALSPTVGTVSWAAGTGGDGAAGEGTAVGSLPEGPGTQAARELGYRFEAPAPASPPAPAGPEQGPAPPSDADPAAAVEELVFFGRLETRKGLEIFCDALDQLADERRPPELRVTFMGSETLIQGVDASQYLRRRSRCWPWEWGVETGFNQHEAVAYLRRPGRLAVMPSPVDNSPNTVLEALGLGIPFITSSGGGIPELIHPLDLERATFDPHDTEGRRVDPADPYGFVADVGGRSLAAAIHAALAHRQPLRPRFAVEPEDNGRAHVEWHERVAAATARRGPRPMQSRGEESVSVSVCLSGGLSPDADERASRSLERQDIEEMELVFAAPTGHGLAWARGVAGGLRERSWRVVEAAPDELDAAAAAAATGSWLLLVDAAATASPALLSTLVAAVQRTGADVATVAAGYPTETTGLPAGGWRGNVPLGDASAVGLFYDCFGTGAVLVRRETFEALGGFEVDGPSAVRRRDLLCRASLAGARFIVVPEPLLSYDREVADQAQLSPTETMLRTLRPYERALPEAFTDLPGLALSLSLVPVVAPPPAQDAGEDEVLARTLEHRFNVIANSRSWRMTRPLRAAMERVRPQR